MYIQIVPLMRSENLKVKSHVGAGAAAQLVKCSPSLQGPGGWIFSIIRSIMLRHC